MSQPTKSLPNIPPLHEYWDRLANPMQGDADKDSLFLHVGKVSSKWESIDAAFATFVTYMVGGLYPAAERMYGLVQNTSAKVQTLSAASEVFFFIRKVDKPYQDCWELLLKHYNNASARRNDIVHAHVSQVLASTDGVTGCFLQPPQHVTPRNMMVWKRLSEAGFTHGYRYNSESIKHFLTLFQNLHGWANELHWALSEKYPPAVLEPGELSQ